MYVYFSGKPSAYILKLSINYSRFITQIHMSFFNAIYQSKHPYDCHYNMISVILT